LAHALVVTRMTVATIIARISPDEIRTPIVVMPPTLYHPMLDGTSLMYRDIGADLPE
jgi:hypothetical protein